MKRVLALQFCWDDPPGYLGDIMQEHNIPYEIVEVDKYPVPDPTEFDAILAMGGFQHVGENEKYPYLVGVESMICKAVAEDIPYLGICLGGQLLAHALGAPVKRHSITPLGFFDVQTTRMGKDDPLFHGLPEECKYFIGMKIPLTSHRKLFNWLAMRKQKIKPFVMDATRTERNITSK